jgi:hypothetical protein
MIPADWISIPCSGSPNCSWHAFGAPGSLYTCAYHKFMRENPTASIEEKRSYMRRVMLGLERVA